MIEENINQNEENTENISVTPTPVNEVNGVTIASVNEAVEVSDNPEVPKSVEGGDRTHPKYVYHWELPTEPADNKNKKRNSGLITFFSALTIALIVAILALAAVIYFTPDNSAGVVSYAKLYEDCCKYTVAIETNAGSIGSGFFVTENGYVVTNHHVISGATSVLVYTVDGEKYSADVVGSDAELDLAVLRVNGKSGQRFPAAPVADSEKVKTGDSIIVIGTPERLDLAWSLASGYVSYAKRESNMSGTMQTYIQISSAVNPGNSGGPLINANGEVIGIVQARVKDRIEVYDQNGQVIGYAMPGADGLGLAIPINKVIDTFEKIIDKNMSEPILGITCVTVLEGLEYFMTDGTAYQVHIDEQTGDKFYISYNSFTQEQTTVYLTEDVLKNGTLFTAKKSGIWIEEVADNSGAKGILKKGDIIIGFGGVDISAKNDGGTTNLNLVTFIKEELAKYKVGDTVNVKYIRDGAEYSVDIILTAKQ